MSKEALFEVALKSEDEIVMYMDCVNDTESWKLNALSLERDNQKSLIEMICQRIQSKDIFFSVEFSPPKTAEGTANLVSNIRTMKTGGALFCSITWHPGNNPGGTTLTSTMSVAALAAKHCSTETVLHMAGSHVTKQEVDTFTKRAMSSGIRNILAIRGDKTSNSDGSANDFPYSVNFVIYLKQKFGKQLVIAVAGYPCGHPEAQSYDRDLQYLKMKVEAGANFILTQMFFEAETFIRFVHDCRAIGIQVPIIPGIMPIQSYSSLMHMVHLTKVKLPETFLAELNKIKHNDAVIQSYGVHKAAELCQKLFDAEVAPGIHIFTLNRESGPIELCKRLGLWICGPQLPLSCKCIQQLQVRSAEEIQKKTQDEKLPTENWTSVKMA